MDFGPSDQHFNMCLNHDLSGIRRSTFNRAIIDHEETRGGHHDGSIKIGRAKEKGDCGPESWDHGSS